MAETRVEKYKEYRKSILSDSGLNIKTAIDTSLEATSVTNSGSISPAELTYLKKVQRTKYFYIFGFLAILVAFFVTVLVFGIVLF